MGQCVSLAPTRELPRCQICGLEATAPWRQMEHSERARWVRHRKGMACRKCIVAKKLAQAEQQKASEGYAKVKEECYPKPSSGVTPLRRVKSGQLWEGTGSFTASWRPSSTLRGLMSAIEQAQQAEPGKYVGMQRKPTGYIPPHDDTRPAPTSGSSLQGRLQAEAAPALPGPAGLQEQWQPQSDERLLEAGRAQLEALEEEDIQCVEELSVEPSSLGDLEVQPAAQAAEPSFFPFKSDQHAETRREKGTEAPAAVRAVQEQELHRVSTPEQLAPPAPAGKPGGLGAAGCHGDSAFMREEEASQWVCGTA